MNTFDKAASTWDENPMRLKLAHAVSSAIKENIRLNAAMEALEYGCGTGLITVELAPCIKNILALDASEGMLSMFRAKIERLGIKNIHPRLMDLTQEPPLNRDFDLIYTSMTLHHIQDVRGLLGKFKKMLNPGGFMALADLDLEDGTFHQKDTEGVRHNGFDRGEILDMLESLGLKNLKAILAHEIKKTSPDGEMRSYPVFLVVGSYTA
ncbi:MAG: class I SAM-dependent methyltransferase [Desulfobacteraceae bacterium]|nr:class I SAM-dependent methyltransferase [Desulfobacteraceae bacterium]